MKKEINEILDNITNELKNENLLTDKIINKIIKIRNKPEIKTEKLYKMLSGICQAYQSCCNNDEIKYYDKEVNETWESKHEDNFEDLILNCFHHGSGIDSLWLYELDGMNSEKMVFSNSWHVMLENGMYDGFIDFKVIIQPSLQHDFNLVIVGRFAKCQDIKEYLYEQFNAMFCQLVNRDTLQPIEG